MRAAERRPLPERGRTPLLLVATHLIKHDEALALAVIAGQPFHDLPHAAALLHTCVVQAHRCLLQRGQLRIGRSFGLRRRLRLCKCVRELQHTGPSPAPAPASPAAAPPTTAPAGRRAVAAGVGAAQRVRQRAALDPRVGTANLRNEAGGGE